MKRFRYDPADLLLKAGCVILALMMLHIVADVAGKYIFNSPLAGTIEVVAAYYMVSVLFLPLGEVARRRDHIYVELFTQGLKQSTQFKIDAVISALGALAVAYVSWQTALEAIDMTANGEAWETAASLITIWPSRWILPIGMGVMSVYMMLAAIECWTRENGIDS
jgi:TRAP-type C4-dicarboxylate transport system permease small subunit